MEFVWDPAKAEANWQKHQVRFADAATVLDDPFALTIEDRRYSEQRFVTIGADSTGHLLVVVHTDTENDDIRIISARKATPSEVTDYEKAR